MTKPMKISPDEVIDRILDLLSAIPELAEDLPEGCRTKGFWKELFARNAQTARLLEMFQELPAFTEQAPAGGDAAGWRKLMEKDYKGPRWLLIAQASGILMQAVAAGNEKPYPKGPFKYWRDRFDASQTVQRVRPTETDEYLHNPHRGTTTFQRFQGDGTYAAWFTSDTHGPIEFAPDAPVKDNLKYIPRTTLTYCRWPWSWLEPEKGKFNWKIIDQTLKTAHNRGQTAQLRFQPYTQAVKFAEMPPTTRRHPPVTTVNVPDWYWDTGAKWIDKGAYAANEPDCNDPKYLKHFGDFVRAFAKRYDGHPDIESVDVAYAGFWGESGGNTTPETARKLTDVYIRSFKKTTLLSMLGTDGCKHAHKVTADTNHPAGWRADCIGDLRKRGNAGVPPELCWNHTFDAYPMQIVQDGLKDDWMKAPVTMETCGNVTTYFMGDYDLDVIIREGYRYHMSVFMPKSSFYPQAFQAKLEEFDKKIGYRFVLRQMQLPIEAKPLEKVNLLFFFDNVGCAPIYRPYNLAVRFRQGKTSKVVRLKNDIRQWMPGHTWFEEKITVPKGLKKGEANIDLVIVDEKDRPKVWLAIQGLTEDKWHPLTSMDII